LSNYYYEFQVYFIRVESQAFANSSHRNQIVRIPIDFRDPKVRVYIDYHL